MSVLNSQPFICPELSGYVRERVCFRVVVVTVYTRPALHIIAIVAVCHGGARDCECFEAESVNRLRPD